MHLPSRFPPVAQQSAGGCAGLFLSTRQGRTLAVVFGNSSSKGGTSFHATSCTVTRKVVSVSGPPETSPGAGSARENSTVSLGARPTNALESRKHGLCTHLDKPTFPCSPLTGFPLRKAYSRASPHHAFHPVSIHHWMQLGKGFSQLVRARSIPPAPRPS